MIHEGFVNHPDLMANDQCPMVVRPHGALSSDSKAGRRLDWSIGDWDLVIPAMIRDGIRE